MLRCSPRRWCPLRDHRWRVAGGRRLAPRWHFGQVACPAAWETACHACGPSARSGRAKDDKLQIAIAVRKLKAYGDRDPGDGAEIFKQSIRASIVSLVRDKGAEVTFFSTCQGIPEYWTDDSKIALNFAADLPADVAPHVQVDRAFHTPADLIKRLQGFDGVIACRLHMAIMSICANTPVLPVSYEPKSEDTFADLGRPELVIKIDEIEPEPFTARALDWVDSLDQVAADLNAAAPRLKASALSAGPLLEQALASQGLVPPGAQTPPSTAARGSIQEL